ncbi:MAG: copper amine oxidase N-terminal domain-containing protein [Firmicutes bacterium]|nr:copper amine oxidase N-terminal domain-containing protein [Bacillota bacterium]
MKRLLKNAVILTLLLVLLSPFMVFPVPADAAAPRVIVDGETLRFDVPPVIENGRTLVPMRAIFEALGAVIAWDPDTQTVTAGRGDTAIAVQIDNPLANVNGSGHMMDVAPKMIGGRTMVPLRFVSEALGCEVGWTQPTATITITSGGAPVENNDPSGISVAASIMGAWSNLSSSPAGSLVDPVTGFATGSYYSGEWYFFDPDGTCRYVIIGSGTIINGLSEVRSNYRVVGDRIVFTNRLESFTPALGDKHAATKNTPISDETLTFSYDSADDTLRIDSSTFHRINY